ncbi:MAG: subunit of tubulin prefoldin [Icmadophila ericetorum]|nr:subunit of tubulin prefoldin [Icmadophila ericetorum]
MASQQGQTVDLASLSASQLGGVKKQLDDELEHLTISFNKLRAAQARFRECLKSMKDGVSTEFAGKAILVPLTTSLYVHGHLANTENVLIDVGTGFYVEKSVNDARDFYNARIDGLSVNLKDLDGVLQGKSNNLRVVEDVMRQKVLLEASKA